MDRTTSSDMRGPESGRDNPSARLLFERYETDNRFFDETFESTLSSRVRTIECSSTKCAACRRKKWSGCRTA